MLSSVILSKRLNMKEIITEYVFSAKVWKYEGPNGWYFVSVPGEHSKEIRKYHFESEEGWGRLKSIITISESTWKSSIWFDTKHNCYLVPIKADIRRKHGITDGSNIELRICIED